MKLIAVNISFVEVLIYIVYNICNLTNKGVPIMNNVKTPWYKNMGDVPQTIEYHQGSIFDAVFHLLNETLVGCRFAHEVKCHIIGIFFSY